MKKITLAFLMSISSQVFSQDLTILCLSEVSTGFSFEKKSQKWVDTKFITTNERFILKKTNSGYTVKRFDGISTTNCDSTDTHVNGFLSCPIPDGDFFINLKSKRFQYYHRIGYVGMDKSIDELGLTPNISIGTCSTL